MNENYQEPVRMGGWADSLGNIVDKTEQNLYGGGPRPRYEQTGDVAPTNQNICISEEVYPLSLGNFLSRAGRSTQQEHIENREREYMEDQFKKDVVKNIETIDKKLYKETDY